MKKIKNDIFISIIIICVVLSFLLLYYINRKVVPILEKYGESTMNNILSTTINDVVKSEFKNKNLDNMINIIKDNDNIELIDYNTQVINEILSDVTDKILVSIKNIEISNIKNYKEENMVYNIPISMATNNVFFGNLGPRIPIKFNVIGHVDTSIKSEIKEYGINNALIKIYINIKLTSQVIVPFSSKETIVSLDVPISYKLIKGTVPRYYGGLIRQNSNLLSTNIE